MQGADPTQITQALQDHTRIWAAIQQVLKAGLMVLPYDAQYTYAALPATAAVGTRAYCTNGRKPAEGAGSGTGVPVWFDVSGVWFSFPSGAAVTV